MKNIAKKLMIAGLPVALGVGLVLPAGADEDVVKYRQSVMKAIVGHTGGVVAILTGKVPHEGHLITHASGLNDTAQLIGDAFAEETLTGETRALDKIWNDAEGFKKAYTRLQDATAALLEAARSGGVEAAKAKLEAVGDACKGCHEEYRKKKS